jgi:hypothetical protein
MQIGKRWAERFCGSTILAAGRRNLYFEAMNLAEIEQEAMALSEHERATLAVKLLHTLPPSETYVSDDEVERRERELESGEVEAISHDELVRRVERERGK